MRRHRGRYLLAQVLVLATLMAQAASWGTVTAATPVPTATATATASSTKLSTATGTSTATPATATNTASAATTPPTTAATGTAAASASASGTATPATINPLPPTRQGAATVASTPTTGTAIASGTPSATGIAATGTATTTGTATATGTASVAPQAALAPACPAVTTPTDSLAILARDADEVAGLRTRNSRTFVPRPGASKQVALGHTAVIAQGSLNYQDGQGKWQTIDNTLVARAPAGFAYANTANRYTLALPASANAPVRVALGNASVEMALQGAGGSAALCRDTLTYANALPGVSLAYTAGDDTVKETLTLTDTHAPHRFTYRLRTSPGLTARANGAGGIDFVDGAGTVPFAFAAPFMDDHAGKPAGHSTAVTLTLGQDANGPHGDARRR